MHTSSPQRHAAALRAASGATRAAGIAATTRCAGPTRGRRLERRHAVNSCLQTACLCFASSGRPVPDEGVLRDRPCRRGSHNGGHHRGRTQPGGVVPGMHNARTLPWRGGGAGAPPRSHWLPVRPARQVGRNALLGAFALASPLSSGCRQDENWRSTHFPHGHSSVVTLELFWMTDNRTCIAATRDERCHSEDRGLSPPFIVRQAHDTRPARITRVLVEHHSDHC